VSLIFRIQYDGTGYAGWERQPGRRTVQGEFERVLREVTGITARTLAASRTDAGVHAGGQVVAWHTEACRIPRDRLPVVINRRLPPSIRVLAVTDGPPAFDPRRAARAKTYSYTLWVAPGPVPPEWATRALAVDGPLSLACLNAASLLFLGRHDFRAFRGEGSSAVTTVRTIYQAHWEATPPLWRFWITGDGFLYHMVRFLVGSMIEAARSGSDAAIRSALAHPEGPKAAVPAPAHGLRLESVEF
jgi:tRNA pseudouridine38-40 synthase